MPEDAKSVSKIITAHKNSDVSKEALVNFKKSLHTLADKISDNDSCVFVFVDSAGNGHANALTCVSHSLEILNALDKVGNRVLRSSLDTIRNRDT